MKRLLFISAFLITHVPTALAGSGGTESPFAMGAGAADIALGGARLAQVSGWTTPFWNPSGLAATEQAELGGFHSRLFDSDVSYQYLGMAYPTLDLGAFGLGIFRLGINGIEKRDAANLYLGEIDDSRLGIYFAYGKSISGYDFGLALSMEHHSIDQYSTTSSPGLTLSLTRRWEFDSRIASIASAAVLRNVVSRSMKLDNADVSYPVSSDLAVSVGLRPKNDWNHLFSLYASMSKVDALKAQISVGGEYSVGQLLHLRGGWSEKSPALGIGLEIGQFAFDYALVDRDLGTLHMFSVTSSFGKARSTKLKERLDRQEKDFNRLMSDQMQASNEKMLSQLLEKGHEALDSGDLVQAEGHFDRALFIARTAERDTAEISASLSGVRERLNEVSRLRQYNDHLDSAQINYAATDFLAARYYASLALQIIENSEQAKELIRLSEEKLQEESSRDDLVSQRILLSDSLVNYGRADEAINILRSLKEIARADNRVEAALKRAHFERFRVKASRDYSALNYRQAIVDLDSALAYYPGHQWCESLKEEISARLKRSTISQTGTPPARKTNLSPELKKEVEEYYQRGRQLFTSGNLNPAIENWERVERIAPDYESVREYLVNAYKFIGVELYGEGKLADAVNIWKKAASLMPDNREIGEYITRTENEIRKLDELSYEP